MFPTCFWPNAPAVEQAAKLPLALPPQTPLADMSRRNINYHNYINYLWVAETLAKWETQVWQILFFDSEISTHLSLSQHFKNKHKD